MANVRKKRSGVRVFVVLLVMAWGGAYFFSRGPHEGDAPQDDSLLPAPRDPAGSPETISALTRAIELTRQHEFAQAELLLQAVVRKAPGNARAQRYLGDCCYNQHRFDDAIRAYDRALKTAGESYFALRGSGVAHLHRGHARWQEQERLRKAGKRHEAGGAMQQAHQDYARAHALLKRCVEERSDDAEAAYALAMAAEAASRKAYSSAVALFGRGDDDGATGWSGECLALMDDGAIAAGRRMALVPGETGPGLLLGGLHLRQAHLLRAMDRSGDAIRALQAAIAAYEGVLRMHPDGQSDAEAELSKCRDLLKTW